MMKIVTDPKYDAWREWLEQLPATFLEQGKVIYDARNQIRIMNGCDGSEVCVKRFHAPRFEPIYL